MNNITQKCISISYYRTFDLDKNDPLHLRDYLFIINIFSHFLSSLPLFSVVPPISIILSAALWCWLLLQKLTITLHLPGES